ncbi:MAG: hypothetical protein H6677_02250 [Candidatus Obscuribacterales bacterium]|nr:hypothetical protein [Cyanobacteria bacterium HKST-UBA01]MCB9467069.1 hypothetical protein [Candidatus Obscuribacterales bacterium]
MSGSVLGLLIALAMLGVVSGLYHWIFKTNQGSFLDITRPLRPYYINSVLICSFIFTAVWLFAAEGEYAQSIMLSWTLSYWPGLALLRIFYMKPNSN